MGPVHTFHTELRYVKENSTYVITGAFKDGAGVAIPLADLQTVKMWLFDHLGNVINAISNIDIKNVGRGVITAGGLLTLTLGNQDNPIVADSNAIERHLLVIEWTWNGGTDKSHEDIYLYLVNDEKVPTAP